MGRSAVVIELTAGERAELEGWAGRRRTAQGLARRARIVLLAAEGLQSKAIAAELGADQSTVGKWRNRFARDRLQGLHDEPRPGAPRKIGDDASAETIRLTLETTPADATHWSLRSMAKAVGYAPSTIPRIWRAFSLQPHRTETFELSSDPMLVDKVRDPCGGVGAPHPTGWGAISIRRIGPWFCASTRSHRSKPWTVPNPCCPCAPARSSAVPTTPDVTAPPRCSLLSTLPPAT